MQDFIVGFIPLALRENPDVFRRARLLVGTSFISKFVLSDEASNNEKHYSRSSSLHIIPQKNPFYFH